MDGCSVMRNVDQRMICAFHGMGNNGVMSIFSGPRIDCHAHIYTLDMPLAPTAWHRPPADASIEAYQQVLAQAGIRYGVIAASSLHGDNCDYTLAALKAWPNLKATVIVSPDVTDEALAVMADAGVVGIRLQWLGVRDTPCLEGADYRRLLSRIAKLGWHVELHDHGRRLAPAIAAVEAHGIPLVIDHFGRPLPDAEPPLADIDAVLSAVGRGRTWVKLASDFRLASFDLAAAATGALLGMGRLDRLMWGSDWPFANFEDRVDYDDVLAAYQALVPDPEMRAAIDRTGMDFYFADVEAARSTCMALDRAATGMPG